MKTPFSHLLASIFVVLFYFFSNCNFSKKEQPNADNSSEVIHFERLASVATGIDFQNIIEENEHANYLTLNHLYLGGAVAAGDFDRDGRPDLFFVSTTGQPKLYLNRGDFRFEDVTIKCGIGQISGMKTGVAVADVDANGWLDIYLCRVGQTPEMRGNLLFLNQGNAIFTESAAKVGLDTRSTSTHATFFDYDRDGDLDCYIINRPANFSTVSSMRAQQIGQKLVRQTAPETIYESDLLMQNNDGFFSDCSKKAGIFNRKFSLSMLVQDFNGDGWPDIYIANDYIEPDILYLNNKNGTFSDHFADWFRHTSYFSMGSDAADLNNDGLPELVSLDMNPATRIRQKQTATPMVPDRYNSLVNYGYGHQMMRNMLQINHGDGFSEVGCAANIPNTDWSWSPLLQDFDNDGQRDLFISNGFKRDVNDLDFVHFTLDSLLKRPGLNANARWQTINAATVTPLHNYFFKNQGHFNFLDVSESWGFSEKGLSNAAIYADLDGDGDLEIIVNNTDESASIYKNLTREKNIGGHFLQIKLEGSPKTPDGFSTKIRVETPDRQIQFWEMQPTRGFLSSVEQLAHFGLGKNEIVSKLEIFWLDGRSQVLENVKIDQKIIVKWADARGNDLFIYKKPTPKWHESAKKLGIQFAHRENIFNDFDRERLIPHKMSNLGPALATGDLNGDGLEDFFIGGAFKQRGSVFFQQKNGQFRASQTGFENDTLWEDTDALIFDADGDHDQDLLVVSGGNEAPTGQLFYYDRLYLNDGTGALKLNISGMLPREDEPAGAIEPFDVDSDGDLDLFVGGGGRPGRYPMAAASYVLLNQKGQFSNATAQIAPGFEKIGMVADLVFADLDGDKMPELIACGEWTQLMIFKNLGGKFEQQTANFVGKNTAGWWQTVRAGDLDGDGDLDLAVGNHGLNTRYQASTEEPIELFAKDFDGNGSLDPVICAWENNRLSPVPFRDQLLKQLPNLKKKFVKYAAYANAEVTDFFPKKELEAAAHFYCQNLASGWFENTGKGQLVFHEFPLEAQTSPIKSLIINDLDNDGDLDIFTVGNDFGFEIESGRCDSGSGLLLENDGKGHFVAKIYPKTGLRAIQDARKTLILTKANGGKMILVGNNNGALECFE